MDEKTPGPWDDLREFLMSFMFATADAIQATQGRGGLRIMSVSIGSSLWDDFEDKFPKCDASSLKTRDEKISCFMETLTKTGIIKDYTLSHENNHLKIAIKNCFFLPASNRQMEAGLIHPLCPIGGLIVMGLHERVHVMATLEKIEHDPKSGVSRLTFAF
jgi:hypothetical protein